MSLGPPEIAILDEYEGVAADRYVRTSVDLTTTGSIHSVGLSAIVYIATDSQPGPPRPGYLETILQGADDFGLPLAYRQQLENWKHHD